MAHETKIPNEDLMVSKIVKDPSNPPRTLILCGYIGRSSEDDYIRLYLEPTLADYIDIPPDVFLHSVEIPMPLSYFGGHLVWIDKKSDVIHGRMGEDRFKAPFVEGRMRMGYKNTAGYDPKDLFSRWYDTFYPNMKSGTQDSANAQNHQGNIKPNFNGMPQYDPANNMSYFQMLVPQLWNMLQQYLSETNKQMMQSMQNQGGSNSYTDMYNQWCEMMKKFYPGNMNPGAGQQNQPPKFPWEKGMEPPD